MRLINVNTLELNWFTQDSPDFPPYVIASHTWEEDEVTYEEHEAWLKARAADPQTPEPDKAGFQKLKEFCRIAREEFHVLTAWSLDPHGHSQMRKTAFLRSTNADDACGKAFHSNFGYYLHEPEIRDVEDVRWAWIDTCCIDKRSSAELSEAINSMFRWYSDAATCVAYLQDVSAALEPTARSDTKRANQSKWFTRGWTLQELIAPIDVHFYNETWSYCFSRNTHYRGIASITKIDHEVLSASAMGSSITLSAYTERYFISRGQFWMCDRSR